MELHSRRRERAVVQPCWVALGCLVLGLLLLTAVGLGAGSAQTAAPDQDKPGSSRPEPVLQSGHTFAISQVTFSPDGRWLASGSWDKTIKLWDVATGYEVRTFNGHTDAVTSIVFSPDGRWLASGSGDNGDNTVKMWEVATGRELASMAAHSTRGHVMAVAFSPDGRWLASGALDGTLKLWEMATGRELASVAAHAALAGVTAVAFSPDGRWLASASADNTAKRWEIASETLVGRSEFPVIRPLAFSPDGGWLASAALDGTLKLWEMATGRELGSFAGHTKGVMAAVFSPDGGWLASTGAQDNTATLWEVATGRQVWTVTGYSGPVSGVEVHVISTVAFSPDGRWLATGGWDKTIKLWEVATGRELRSSAGRTQRIGPVAFSPDGRWLATGGETNTVSLWDLTVGGGVRLLAGHSHSVRTVAFSPDGRWLASGSAGGRDYTIKLWEVATGRELRTLAASGGGVVSVAFSADGRWLASASMAGTIMLWEVATGRELRTFAGRVAKVDSYAFRFSADGRWLAWVGEDDTIALWEVATGRQLLPLAGHTAAIGAITFSADGRWLASASWDKTIRLWEVATGRHLRTLPIDEGVAQALAFSPDGRTLARTLGRVVELWDIATWRREHTLTGHTDGVVSVAFSPDGQWVASGSADGSTRLWNAASGAEVAVLSAMWQTGDWVVVTPDGLFDGSERGFRELVAWRFSQNTFDTVPVEVFFNDFFSPGLLTDILARKRPKAPRNIAQLDRRQPQLTLAHRPAAAGGSLATRTIAVTIDVAEAPADRDHPVGSGARDVRLFRNGSLVKVWRGEVLQGNEGKGVLETTLPIMAGENRLTAYAFNRDNVKSRDATLVVTGADSLKRAGTLYILVVGINRYANLKYDLRYAVADAQVFAEELRRRQAELGTFTHIEVIPLLDQAATKANILRALRRLSGGEGGPPPAGTPAILERIKPTAPEDAVVMYFAGHGTAQRQRFYLIPHDLGYTGTRTQLNEAGLKTILAHSISDQDLEQALEQVDAGYLLFVIDACNSGQALEAEEKRRGPMNTKGLVQLAYEKGMYILTAAQSYQAALEAAQLGHGYLTYALVEEGLKTPAADTTPKDGQVVLREWFDYAMWRVPQMQLAKMQEGRELKHEIAFVQGEEKLRDLAKRRLQRPRAFYRRELEVQPFVVTKTNEK
jgi:WD40 repeat protein